MFTMVSIDCAPLARIARPVACAKRSCAQKLSRRRIQLCGAMLAVAAVAGCGGGSQPTQSSEEGQIRAALKLLGMEYGAYMASHNGAPPADDAAIRKHLESRLPDLTDIYNVKSVDTLLRTGRDGQPLAVIVGKKVEVPERSPYPWAAYEQMGVDGKRLVSDTRGGVYEIEEQEFKQHVADGL
jgi:hypothetical protein